MITVENKLIFLDLKLKLSYYKISTLNNMPLVQITITELPIEILHLIYRHLSWENLKKFEIYLEEYSTKHNNTFVLDDLKNYIFRREAKLDIYKQKYDEFEYSLQDRMTSIIGNAADIVFLRTVSCRTFMFEDELSIRKRFSKRYLSEENYEAVKKEFIIPNFKVYHGKREINRYELYEIDSNKLSL